MPLWQQRLLLAVCVLIGAGVFFSGIDWGLPSKIGDLYFFNGHPVMNGGEIQVASEGLAAVKGASPKLGADVDRNPRGAINEPALVNNGLGANAEIVRRYRLFSYQPDEMITFMALRSMQPAKFDFDPHLYQYGGLWIYPIALCLKVGETFRF